MNSGLRAYRTVPWLACLFALGTLHAQIKPLYDYLGNKDKVVASTESTDIVYAKGAVDGGASTKDLHLDVHVPVGLDGYRKAAVLVIHGGGFTGGEKSSERPACQYYARRGFVAFTIQYRLKGDKPPTSDSASGIRAATVDAKAALRWIRAHAGEYGIDTANIFIGGTSAGAITSLFAGVTEGIEFLTDKPGDPIPASNNPAQSMEVRAIIDFCGGLYGYEGSIDAQDPPILIFHGTADPIVPFSLAVAIRDRSTQVGLPYEYYPIQGGGHCPAQPAENGKNIFQLSHEFFLKHLRAPATTAVGERKPVTAASAAPVQRKAAMESGIFRKAGSPGAYSVSGELLPEL